MAAVLPRDDPMQPDNVVAKACLNVACAELQEETVNAIMKLNLL